ncbi:hypothetical protein [Delftia tsuruhatensis]|uniref:hypothetical protein n=1 Tax=Delftia tsuruhatensis TaxID=180282 RepID=UPI003A898CF4
MRAAITQLALYAGMYGLLWAWVGEGVEGAGNLLALMVGVLVLANLCNVGRIDRPFPERAYALPFAVDNVLSIGLVMAMVWYGHWVMGIGLLLAWMLGAGTRLLRQERQQREQRQ